MRLGPNGGEVVSCETCQQEYERPPGGVDHPACPGSKNQQPMRYFKLRQRGSKTFSPAHFYSTLSGLRHSLYHDFKYGGASRAYLEAIEVVEFEVRSLGVTSNGLKIIEDLLPAPPKARAAKPKLEENRAQSLADRFANIEIDWERVGGKR